MLVVLLHSVVLVQVVLHPSVVVVVKVVHRHFQEEAVVQEVEG